MRLKIKHAEKTPKNINQKIRTDVKLVHIKQKQKLKI